jgi:hypothetical protein
MMSNSAVKPLIYLGQKSKAHFAAVFKGFAGNRKIGGFLLVAQW